MYNLRTWLGDGGQSSVDVKLLCAEEKSLLLSVLLLKGKVPAEACCALGGSAVSCDPSVRRITPLRGLESLQRVSSLSSDTWSGAQLSALSSSLSLALSSGKLFELIELQHLENSTAKLSPVYILQEFFFSLGFFFLMEESHTPTVVSEAPSLVQSPGPGCAGQPDGHFGLSRPLFPHL